MVVAPESAVGDRLPSISELAFRFGTSARTVHIALEQLEKQGHVLMKHGSGTYIASKHRPLTMKSAVAVCMEAGAHLFGDLAGCLVGALNRRHLVAVVMDTLAEQTNSLVARMSHTEAACFMVHGSSDMWPLLRDCVSRTNKPVISFIDHYAPENGDRIYSVLTDFDLGGRMVARHLLGQGHRRVLVLGTGTATPLWTDPVGKRIMPGTSFVEEWHAGGGTWVAMEVVDDPGSVSGYALDEERFVGLMTAPDAPTAVFGVRDVDAWQAQQAIGRRLPALRGKVTVVGYFDTPWSRAGSPPFATVSLDLPRMAHAAMGMLDRIVQGGKPEPTVVTVAPKLVPR